MAEQHGLFCCKNNREIEIRAFVEAVKCRKRDISSSSSRICKASVPTYQRTQSLSFIKTERIIVRIIRNI